MMLLNVAQLCRNMWGDVNSEFNLNQLQVCNVSGGFIEFFLPTR